MKGKYFIVLLALLALFISSAALFADPNDLDTWQTGAENTGALSKAEKSAKSLGLAFDRLISLIGRILISLVVSWFGIKYIFNKNASSKTTIKEQIPFIIGGAVILYFGIDILKMILNMINVSFFK